jgi:hypothetical protein
LPTGLRRAWFTGRRVTRPRFLLLEAHVVLVVVQQDGTGGQQIFDLLGVVVLRRSDWEVHPGWSQVLGLPRQDDPHGFEDGLFEPVGVDLHRKKEPRLRLILPPPSPNAGNAQVAGPPSHRTRTRAGSHLPLLMTLDRYGHRMEGLDWDLAKGTR